MIQRRSRREVLEAAGYGAVALAAAGYGRASFAANDAIGVGLIGCGGRMHIHLAPALAKIPGVKIVAGCDVYSEHRKSIQAKVGHGFPVTADHHELLARPDVDAVVIATPDHLHVPLTIDACRAGKDVYCEKPFTHNLTEGAAAIEAQNQYKRIVQIGTQQRSMTHLIEAKQLVDQGVLGKVHKVRMTWNRNLTPITKPKYNIKPEQVDWEKFLGTAPDQPFDPHRLRNWRWFWDFGGGIFTDLMVHWYDTVNWMLGLGVAQSAMSLGDHFASQGVWETPDTVNTLLHFPDKGVQAQFEGTFVTQRGKAHAEIMGEQATLYIDRGRYELIPEPGRGGEPKQLVLGTGDPGADFYDKPDGEVLHLAHWIDCIRTRTKPNCPAEAGVEASYTAWLANKALRGGGAAKLGA